MAAKQQGLLSCCHCGCFYNCCSYAHLIKEEGLEPESAVAWPSWQSRLRATAPHRHEHDSSVVIDLDQRYWSSPSGEAAAVLCCAAPAVPLAKKACCTVTHLQLPHLLSTCPDSSRRLVDPVTSALMFKVPQWNWQYAAPGRWL
jgi:hypothetical protein